MERYLISAFCITILLLNLTSAVKVGVYLESREREPESYCLSVDEGDDAYEVLSKIRTIEFENIEDQHILCKMDSDISFICDSTSDKSIRVVLQNNGKWLSDPIPSYDSGEKCADDNFNLLSNFIYYSFKTHTFSNAHYCAKDKDVLGVINEPKPQGRPGTPKFSFTPTFKQICESLQIKDMNVFSGGEEINNIDDNGGKIKKVVAGKELELNFNVENILPEFGKEIKDIEIKGVIESDKWKDIKGDAGISNLKPGKDNEVSLYFSIPKDFGSDNPELTITLTGKDDLKNDYETIIEYDLYIENQPNLENTKIRNNNSISYSSKNIPEDESVQDNSNEITILNPNNNLNINKKPIEVYSISTVLIFLTCILFFIFLIFLIFLLVKR